MFMPTLCIVLPPADRAQLTDIVTNGNRPQKLCIVLPPADRAQLTDIVTNGNRPQKVAVRARIMLMLADRVRPSHIAQQLTLSRNHVHM